MRSRRAFPLQPRRRKRLAVIVFAALVLAAAVSLWLFSDARRVEPLPWLSENESKRSDDRAAIAAAGHARAIAAGDLEAILIGYGDDASLAIMRTRTEPALAVEGFPALHETWQEILRSVRIPATTSSTIPAIGDPETKRFLAEFQFTARGGELQRWRSVFRFDARDRIVDERIEILDIPKEPATIEETGSG